MSRYLHGGVTRRWVATLGILIVAVLVTLVTTIGFGSTMPAVADNYDEFVITLNPPSDENQVGEDHIVTATITQFGVTRHHSRHTNRGTTPRRSPTYRTFPKDWAAFR